MRGLLNRIIYSFDDNPWKTSVILLFVANFLLLADAEIVLIASLCLIFIYLSLFSINIFSEFTTQKQNERVTMYSNLLNNTIKNLEQVEAETQKTTLFIYDIANLLVTWTTNSLLYRCFRIRKDKNYFTLFLRPILTDIIVDQYDLPAIDLTSSEEKDNYILATAV